MSLSIHIKYWLALTIGLVTFTLPSYAEQSGSGLEDRDTSKYKLIFTDANPIRFTFQTFNKPVKAYDTNGKDLQFKNKIEFERIDFFKLVNFQGITCKSNIKFDGTKFHDNAIFTYLKADSSISIVNAEFIKEVNFTESKFGPEKETISKCCTKTDSTATDFSNTFFWGDAIFYKSKFFNNTSFNKAIFHKDADFRESTFFLRADFRGAIFKNHVDFENTNFKNNIYFSGSKFMNGVDLTLVTMCDSTKIYFTKETFFQPGKLKIPYESIRKRLVFDTTNNKSENEYNDIEHFYRHLKDNYKTQGDMVAANDVMYDLAGKQHHYLTGVNWLINEVYGWTFGWGYTPLRFIFIILIPWLFFHCLWYHKFFHRVVILLDKSLTSEIKETLTHPKYDDSDVSDLLNKPTRIFYALYFSTVVLISPIFKKEWIVREEPLFFYYVFAEWLLGIICFIIFVICVKSNQFDNIKDILRII